tara:strand:- start:10390 stop:11112 length:723 start_codon:yes stop_codon:yes gene_type:complete
MTETTIINPQELGLDDEDWNDPNILDGILLGRRLLRSDAGAIPGNDVIVAHINEDDIAHLESIGAALALQRAILCVMTSEQKKPDITIIKEILARVESRGQVHDELLSAELTRAQNEPIVAQPPESMYDYRPGTVIGLMRRSLDAMEARTYGTESCAVANSLCMTESILDRLDAGRFHELRPAAGSQDQPTYYPMRIRNNLSWLVRNPHADDVRTGRYLKAYDTNIEDLLESIESLASTD